MAKTIRSHSTLPLSCNLSPSTRQTLREWAKPMAGRIGLVLEKLVAGELARMEERQKHQQERQGEAGD